MIRLAILGDVHAVDDLLTASLQLLHGDRFDLAVLTGDVGSDPPRTEPARTQRREGHDASVRRVLTGVGAALACPVIFVPGNHDLRDPVAVEGAINMDGLRRDVAGLDIAGLGGAGPARFGFPYEWTEDEADRALAGVLDGRPAPDLLLSHTPPVGTSLDRIFAGNHVGSRAVRTWLEDRPPRLFVCGHIHEAWGLDHIGDVPCINAGAMGPPAGQAIAWTVTWEDGPRSVEVRRVDPTGRERTEQLEPRRPV